MSRATLKRKIRGKKADMREEKKEEEEGEEKRRNRGSKCRRTKGRTRRKKEEIRYICVYISNL